MSEGPKYFIRSHFSKLVPVPGLRANLDFQICAHLEQTLARFQPKIVGSFAARSGEPDLNSFNKKYLDRVAFPRVLDRSLEFSCVSNLSQLKSGFGGILEPPESCIRVTFERGDLLLIPGIAFDLKGGRVGSGKGFYDRFLADLGSGVQKIGVCWDVRVSESVFLLQAHDVRVDFLCTESGIRQW